MNAHGIPSEEMELESCAAARRLNLENLELIETDRWAFARMQEMQDLNTKLSLSAGALTNQAAFFLSCCLLGILSWSFF